MATLGDGLSLATLLGSIMGKFEFYGSLDC